MPDIGGTYKGVLMQVIHGTGTDRKWLKGCGTIWSIHPDFEPAAVPGTFVKILNDYPPFKV